MKINNVVLLAAAGAIANAHPHGYNHFRHHARRAVVQGAPVYAYKLGDRVISQEEACAGIKAGTLVWADGSAPVDACNTQVESTTESTAEPTVLSVPKVQEKEKVQPTSTTVSVTSATPAATSSSTPSSSSVTTTSSSASSSSTSTSVSSIFEVTGLDNEFPDGELSCDTFPSEYGALNLDYLGLEGWSGLQAVTIVDDVVSSIVTAISGEGGCKEGHMCSYACPPGYQKSQWPSAQGSTGQSVGGLHCKGGKLRLTNPSLSKKLCIPGTGGVYVENTLDENVAVCRTDYPGTESETIPLSSSPGSIQELTSPDESTYYKWEGLPTSAQYYVNKKGVSIEKGCQWGDGTSQSGNWAPINLGVGKSDDVTYISILPNKPTTSPDLDFNVKIEGNVTVSCKFEDGKFYTGDTETSSGCT
ncbi:hypothetical protein KEM55_004945, partial [Ascosphaera atra]